MAAAAYAAGVRFFGASGHSHTEIPHDAGNVLPTDPAEYRKQVLRLRTEYAGRMEVLLGIEQDSGPHSRFRTGRTTGSAPSTTSMTRRPGSTMA